MKYDFYANYCLKKAIDFLLIEKDPNKIFLEFKNINLKDRINYIDYYFKENKKNYIDPLGLDTEMPNIDILPPFSFYIKFEFQLNKSYISKDDKEFYILDNPIKKEKVFQIPYIAPSQWKGMLRNTLYKKEKDKAHEDPIIRLFGNDNEEEDQDKFIAGRLNFYPTFFYEIGYEVINPHDRKTSKGTHPIYFETIPKGAKGFFKVLYVPFNRSLKDYKKTCSEVSQDLELLIKGIYTLFRTNGLGAKTSSGFGIAKEKITSPDFKINIKEKIDISKISKGKKLIDLRDRLLKIAQNLKEEDQNNG